MTTTSLPQFEKIQVTSREISCDGGGGALGHPKVYLHIDADQGDSVVCPYCSRLFIYRAKAPFPAGAA